MNRWELVCWFVLAIIGGAFLVRSWPPTALGAPGPPGLVSREIGGPDGRPRRYVLYVPREHERSRRLPLIVFLHGVGDIGFDGRRQLKSGLGPELWSRERTGLPFPYFVLFPQARDPWSADSADGRALIDILDRTLAEYPIDPDRVYLTGLSSGGEGVLDLAASHPERWAALVPISCVVPRLNVDRLKFLPIRWYQNTFDAIGRVRGLVADLKKGGCRAELIEFDDLSHDAWTRAYADPGLYDWLNQQVRRPRERGGERIGEDPRDR